MYAGQVDGGRPAAALFAAPRHPYTAALLAALPTGRATGAAADHPRRRPRPADRPAGCRLRPALLPGRSPLRQPGAARARPAAALAPLPVPATHDACSRRTTCAGSTAVKRLLAGAAACCARWTACPSRRARPTLAVVGESGCGKSTLARMLALLEPPTGGRIRIDGATCAPAHRRPRRCAAHVQMVFQDPFGSLNPRQTVGAILEEPLLIDRRAGRERARRARWPMLARGRPAPRPCRPLPAPVLRRPAPAHRHRPRADAAARAWWSPTSRSPRSTSRSGRRC